MNLSEISKLVKRSRWAKYDSETDVCVCYYSPVDFQPCTAQAGDEGFVYEHYHGGFIQVYTDDEYRDMLDV